MNQTLARTILTLLAGSLLTAACFVRVHSEHGWPIGGHNPLLIFIVVQFVAMYLAFVAVIAALVFLIRSAAGD